MKHEGFEWTSSWGRIPTHSEEERRPWYEETWIRGLQQFKSLEKLRLKASTYLLAACTEDHTAMDLVEQWTEGYKSELVDVVIVSKEEDFGGEDKVRISMFEREKTDWGVTKWRLGLDSALY